MNSSELPTFVVRTGLLELNEVSTKFQTFFDIPAIWFTQIEIILRISTITRDSTKFNNQIANQPPQILMKFYEFIINTSPNAYEDPSISRKTTFQHSIRYIRKTICHPISITQTWFPTINKKTDIVLRTAFVKALLSNTKQHQSLTNILTNII